MKQTIIGMVITGLVLIMAGGSYLIWDGIRYGNWIEERSLLIEEGMSSDDVTRILGPPDADGSWSGSYGSGDMLHYSYGNIRILLLSITFRDDVLLEITAERYLNRDRSMVIYRVREDGSILDDRKAWDRIR